MVRPQHIRIDSPYQILFDLSPSGILLEDARGNILDVNDALCSMFGYCQDELIGKNVRLLVPPSRHEKVEEHLSRILSEGRFDHEVINIRKDGTHLFMELRETKITLPDGSDGILVVANDVTERTRTEQALKDSEERFRRLVELSPDAIVVHCSGQIVFANDAAAKLVGASSTREMLGKPVMGFVSREYQATAAGRIQTMLDTGESTPFIEEKFIRLDGQEVDVEVVATPLNYDGHPCIQVIARNITERKKSEIALQQAEEKYRNIIENAVEGIFQSTADGRILMANPALARMLGYKSAEDLIAAVTEVERQLYVHTPSRQEWMNLVDRSGFVQGWETQLYRKDGSVIWASQNIRAVRDLNGSIQYYEGTVEDITHRVRTEESLRDSEAKYRELVEQAVDGIFIVDSTGRINLVNPKGCDMLGYSEEELLQLNIADTYPLEECERAHDKMNGIQGNGTLQFERRMRRKDGTLFPVEVNLRRLADGRFQGIIRDLTERKKAEESMQKLQRAVEQTDEVVMMTEVDGTLTYVNPAFEKVYGYSKHEALGQTPRILKSGSLTQEDYEDFWKVILSGKSIRGEITNRTKDGRIIVVEESVNPVYSSDGTLGGFISVQEDITDKKRVEEERRALEMQLMQAQKIESIGTLAGGIAHDFNNVLGIILGYASLLERTADDPEKLTRSTQAIGKAVQRGAGLVRQILTFARKTEVSIEQLNLNDSVRELARMLEETFPKTIEISLELQLNDPFIDGDRTQIHQTLLNLSVNARDAMPEGGTLSFRTKKTHGANLSRHYPEAMDGEYIQLSVSDTGTGMDETTRRRIFEPFFTTKELGKGTGLGLAVVYGIMKSHQGFIDVESEPGRGTTFHLFFPIPKRQSATAEADTAQGQEAVGGSETVLIVEDEELLRELLESLLESKGYTVLKASDGADAIEVYTKHQEQIGLVLTDVGLPKLGGSEVFFRLRALNPQARILLASGYLEPALREKLAQAGANGFVQKPYVPVEILKLIRATLDQKPATA